MSKRCGQRSGTGSEGRGMARGRPVRMIGPRVRSAGGQQTGTLARRAQQDQNGTDGGNERNIDGGG